MRGSRGCNSPRQPPEFWTKGRRCLTKCDNSLVAALWRRARGARPRWKRVIGEAEGMPGELIGKAYVPRIFLPENRR